jgi:hypothetical protein
LKASAAFLACKLPLKRGSSPVECPSKNAVELLKCGLALNAVELFKCGPGVLVLSVVLHRTAEVRRMELGYVSIAQQTRRVRRDVPYSLGYR